MSSLTEQRLYRLEQQLQADEIAIANLKAQVAALKQQMWAAGGGGGGGGSAPGFFVVMPSGAVAGATWSGPAPVSGVSFTGTVYQVSGTGTATNLGSQTCVNWLPAALVASKAVIVMPDGTGDYATAGQSCT